MKERGGSRTERRSDSRFYFFRHLSPVKPLIILHVVKSRCCLAGRALDIVNSVRFAPPHSLARAASGVLRSIPSRDGEGRRGRVGRRDGALLGGGWRGGVVVRALGARAFRVDLLEMRERAERAHHHAPRHPRRGPRRFAIARRNRAKGRRDAARSRRPSTARAGVARGRARARARACSSSPTRWLLLDPRVRAEAFATAHEKSAVTPRRGSTGAVIFNALVKAARDRPPRSVRDRARARPGAVQPHLQRRQGGDRPQQARHRRPVGLRVPSPFVALPVAAVTYGAAAAKAGGAWAVAAVAVLDRVAATHPELASNVSRAAPASPRSRRSWARSTGDARRAVAMYAWRCRGTSRSRRGTSSTSPSTGSWSSRTNARSRRSPNPRRPPPRLGGGGDAGATDG